MPRQNLDIDKLMEIAVAEDQPRPRRVKPTNVTKYIREVGITSGDTKIPAYIVYYHYYMWGKTKRNTVTRGRFFRQFGEHFERTETDHGRGYLLDPTPFDLSTEGFFKARRHLRRIMNDKKKTQEK